MKDYDSCQKMIKSQELSINFSPPRPLENGEPALSVPQRSSLTWSLCDTVCWKAC